MLSVSKLVHTAAAIVYLSQAAGRRINNSQYSEYIEYTPQEQAVRTVISFGRCGHKSSVSPLLRRMMADVILSFVTEMLLNCY